ncbi:MAG: fructosamine kinase family protein [Cytophagales bacterium]|nr:fructosamine kinase family protein [Cytophagales bacterium]MDW8383230.1 fructosamine kinase family protein [Flammeovirgaceae bacterium]
MMNLEFYENFFESALLQCGILAEVQSYEFVAGGCINVAAKVQTNKGTFFIKWNEHENAIEMFDAEAKGLETLKKTNTFRVPEVIGVGKVVEKSFLLLEYIGFGVKRKDFWEIFGWQLAQLHRNTSSQFGLHFDNFIGSLPQKNTFHDSWHTFYFEERLRPQMELAYYQQLIDKSYLYKLDKLEKATEDLFPQEPPALLHGDLWHGNFLVSPDGIPVLIDPAIYYGHREMELSFMKWLGGFDDTVFQVYSNCYPLFSNFVQRISLYQLYPIIVHLNLFGISYLPSLVQVFQSYSL